MLTTFRIIMERWEREAEFHLNSPHREGDREYWHGRLDVVTETLALLQGIEDNARARGDASPRLPVTAHK